METIDLTKETGKNEIKIAEGLVGKAKIESYGNAGVIDDAGEEIKVMIVQLSIVMPQSQAKALMDMENEENCVNLLIQKIPDKK
jgi:hypothetical protein